MIYQTIPTKKIAIIGAGFIGLSIAYFLSRSLQNTSITIFDPIPIGMSTSGKSAGLLHPFPGKRANFAADAEKAYPSALFLIEEMDLISRTNFCLPIILQRGIVRPALSSYQATDFATRSKEYPELTQYLPKESHTLYPNPLLLPSLFIPSGLAIDSEQYLKTLAFCCTKNNVEYRQEFFPIEEKESSAFDVLCISAGYKTKDFFKSQIITNSVKGQRIILSCPKDLITPSVAISGGAYAIFYKRSICLGSTYERGYLSEDPDPEHAKSAIFPKVEEFWPDLLSGDIESVAAGIRATTQSSYPIVARFPNNRWAITGMGSKGLLYHAWIAQKVATSILE